jgi:hypothetical protein
MKLTFMNRFRLAWEMTWPLALLDLAIVVLIHGAFDVQGEVFDTVWALIAFFGVGPWVVRRALEHRYADWHVVAVARGVEAGRLNYQQSLKVMWLLAWRTIPVALLALLAVSALFRATGASLPHNAALDDPLVNQFGLSLIDTISSLVLYPLLIPGMLKKRYKGFHLEVRSAS